MPNFVRKFVEAEQGEWKPVLFSFCWFFCLMSGYFCLRPIRESLASALGSEQINYLFFFTFLAMLVAAPIYSQVVTMFSRKTLIPIVFHFLVANILIFAAVVFTFGTEDNPLLGKVFFVWVSVFSLFAVSVFWSVLADLFSNEQGKRLFGPISSGGTVGAIVGSVIAGQLTGIIGLTGLLVCAAVLLEVGLLFAARLQRETQTWSASVKKATAKTEGNAWSGFLEIIKSSYLTWICVYLTLISVCGTLVYLQLADVAKVSFADDESRTRFFANINLAVQVGTLVVQTLLVGRIMRYLGLSVALVVLPIVYAISFILLGLDTSLFVLGIIDVVRRIAVYGVTSPSREVLFTVVERDTMYKSKNFMDTVVIRGSDTVTSTAFVQLKSLFASVATIDWIMIPIALLWASIGWILGRKQEQIAARSRQP